MSIASAAEPQPRWRLPVAMLIVFALLLCGCSAAPDPESSSSSPGGGVVTPPIPPVPPATFPITAVADAGGGNIVVTSANTLAIGAVVLISGTTSYNGTFTVVSATPTTFTVTAAFGASETGFWQLAGGPIAGCTTTGATGAITLSNAVSRFTGVAPLAVFFDASGTATVPATPRPFHDLGYSWGFGDAGPSAGAWATGSKPGVSSRNAASGPLAAHVYETAGTYDVTLTITDGANTVTDACVRIAVQDPDVVFAGANTICVGASSLPVAGAGGCPAGAAAQQTADFAVVMGLATTGKRVLLKRGDAWTAPGGAGVPRLSSTGPGIVGAFGGGAAPLVQPVVAGGNTVLAISGPTTPNITDWRFMDLEFNGLSGVNSNGVVGAGGAQQMTFLRMNLHDISNGIQFNAQALDALGGGHLVYDQLTIVDSNIQRIVGSGGNGFFLQATRLAALGNFIEDTTAAEHVVRIQYVSKGVFQANDLGLPATTKHVFTLRAVNVGTGGVTSPNNTEQVVITDSLFRGGLSTQPVSFQPSSGTEDQRIGNIIFDGNLLRAGASTQTGTVSAANEVTLRNNIFVMTGGTAFNCMTFQQLGVEPAHSEIRIYNNTCFSNTASGGALRVVVLDATNSSVAIMNNLGFAPNLTGPSVLLLNSGSAGVTGGSGTFGNSADGLITATPFFTNGSGTFSIATDFKLSVGSYAIDTAVVVPVFSDIFRTTRPQGGGYDTGATEQ